MTPNVEGYFSGTLGGRTVYVELANGTGIFKPRIWGVTVRLGSGDRLTPDVSQGGFESREDALAYIRDLGTNQEGK